VRAELRKVKLYNVHIEKNGVIEECCPICREKHWISIKPLQKDYSYGKVVGYDEKEEELLCTC
jgi:hypothetical protein